MWTGNMSRSSQLTCLYHNNLGDTLCAARPNHNIRTTFRKCRSTSQTDFSSPVAVPLSLLDPTSVAIVPSPSLSHRICGITWWRTPATGRLNVDIVAELSPGQQLSIITYAHTLGRSRSSKSPYWSNHLSPFLPALNHLMPNLPHRANWYIN